MAAAAEISTPVDAILPSSGSGSSIKKPVKGTVKKPCFGCDCGDEEVVIDDHGLKVEGYPVRKLECWMIL
ncbi:hypothetical protein M432DRAFT_640473 [Thermoascus aurantiacus ATCC 26904]